MASRTRKPAPAWQTDAAAMRAEWLAVCERGSRMPLLGPALPTPRLQRLFAVACCRDVWPLMRDERSRRAVDVAERYADGLATEMERQAAAADAYAAYAATAAYAAADAYAATAAYAAYAAATAAYAADAAYAAAADAYAYATADTAAAWKDARRKRWLIQGEILVAMVGPGWAWDADWLTSTVAALSSGICDERAWDRLPILGDALQDAGHPGGPDLDYLYGDAPKFRGCWVLDAILGKRDG